MSKWQPIETAPKDGTRIRVKLLDFFGPYKGHGEISWDDTRGWVNNTDHGPVEIKAAVTHWMPLPDPPDA